MNELIEILIKQLGINESQAKGGAGLLFKVAQDKLSELDFEKVKGVIPDIDDLIRSAPKASGAASLLGGLAAGLGGGKLGALAQLAAGFKALNLDSDQAKGFAKTIATYLEAKGGDSLKTLIETLQAANR